MTATPSPQVRAAEVARTSYGRLLALVAAGTRDLALAEDVLADAFERALRTWPETGVPDNPVGWLLTVARNRHRDVLGSAAVRTAAPLAQAPEHAVPADLDPDRIPDKRLELLFVCAHPAIDRAIRTPLMLSTVLGIEATRIAVLEAVYGAYAIEWQVAGAQERTSLADEARYLAVLLASLLDDAEACGLASLISFAASRARAREVDGRFVPLEEQDPAAWDDGLVADGERLLARATLLRERSGEPIGRFQLEAALQAAHAARRRTGRVDWDGVLRLTEALVTLAPTAGARVALAAASARVHGPEAGLALLDGDPDPRLPRFQPAWATRARLLADAGRVAHARDAYDRAISLTTEPAVRVFLEERRRALG